MNDDSMGPEAREAIAAQLTPWQRACFSKAMFLTGFEGAFTASEYDRLEEDERDFYMIYLSETMSDRKKKMGSD